MAKFACLACGEFSSIPKFAEGRALPWKCGFCSARHELTLFSFDSIENIVLLDRVSLPTLPTAISAGVRSDMQEATTALNAGAHRAACIMLRRAVEHFCASLGGEGRTLEAKIDHLRETRRVAPIVAGGLHALRLIGNDAAHLEGRYYSEITEQDVIDAHGLVIRLLTSASETPR